MIQQTMEQTKIVKIERPLYPETGKVMISSEDGYISMRAPHDGALRMAMAGSIKTYFEVRIDDGSLYIVRRVYGQRW